MDSSLIRAGKEHRVNTDRYFHVMGQGWYVLTREGVDGPHVDRNGAKLVVSQLIDPDSMPVENSNDVETPRWEEFFLR